MLLLLVQKFLLSSLTNWCCSLSAISSIKYALTVNPNIYVSCIKQFWTTVAVKHVNDVTRLQALVDKNKIVVTEATIREALRLDDEEGVDCLPNEEIFAELARMRYKKPSTKLTFYNTFFSSQWNLVRNVDSTTKFYMYPYFLQLIIRKQVGDLSTHTTKYTSPALTQKVFANMRRVGKGFSGVETPLFEGMLVEQQVDEEGDADENVEEVNAGDTAEGDVSAAHGEVPTVVAEPSIPSPTPPTPPPQPTHDIPSTSHVQQTPPQSPQVQPPSPQPQPQPQQAVEFPMNLLQERRMIAKMDQDDAVVLEDDKEEDKEVADAVKDVKEAKVDESAQDQGRQAEPQAKIYKIDMDHANKVLSIHEDETEPAEIQELVDVVTTAKLITEVVTAASETVTAASAIITTAEAQVHAATLIAAPSRRRKGVVIKDPESESTTSIIIPAETKSKDKGKGILVDEPKPLKKKQQIKHDEQYAKELHAELNKYIDWDEVIDHVKLKAKEDPAVKKYQAMKRKPQTKAQARKNMMLYLKNVAGFKMDYFKGMSYDDIRPIFEAKFNSNVVFLLKTKEQIEEDENRVLQKLNETPAERAAKRRKLDQEVEELKRHLQIVPNEDDDVYTEATPLARKVPIVDYQIIEMNNKPYYKIIRADDTHQLYVSFSTLLRNCDREDLEALWSLVKERFSITNPKNFSDDFLLVTLGEMFEKLNIHAQIWKNQRTVHGPTKVKGWKLLESCGVQIITFTSTQLILLVERKYPLIRFTLDQMLNAVRLEVEEESEVSFELLRFIRQQHQEV
nr:xylulose kinase-1 [Tanacetum cinerariifolium]